MAGARESGGILVVAVVDDMAFPKQSFKSIFAHIVPVTVEVVVAHLVNGDAHHEAGVLLRKGGSGKEEYAKTCKEGFQKSHVLFL